MITLKDGNIKFKVIQIRVVKVNLLKEENLNKYEKYFDIYKKI
jgi:hypothetical protein